MPYAIYHIEPIETSLFLNIEGTDQLLKSHGIHPGKLSKEKTFQALKWLSCTGSVYFKKQKLIIDLFTEVEFSLHLEETETLSIEGFVHFKQMKIPLKDLEALFFGDPSCFIYKDILYKFPHNVDWIFLQKIHPFLVLSGKEAQRFKEDLKEETFKSTHNTSALCQPKPFLALTDQSGCFANLGFFYGKEKIFIQEKSSQYRDGPFERETEKDLLELGLQKKFIGSSHYYCPSFSVKETLTFLLELGWKVFSATGTEIRLTTHKEFSSTIERNTVVIQGRLSFQKETISIGKLTSSMRLQRPFIELSDHSYGLIPKEIEKWGLDENLEIVGETLRLKSALLTQVNLPEINSTDKMKSLIEGLSGHSFDTEILPSESFKGTLYPYQQKGLNWLFFLYHNHFNGLLADEMGLGKTVQVLAFLSHFPSHLHLIVAPTSLLHQWKREIERFTKQTVHLLTADLEQCPSHGLLLTSYALLRQEAAWFHSQSFECVILDEASLIKNPDAQISRAAFGLKARFRLSMTGTPFENRFEDIWSQFFFLEPGLLGQRNQFEISEVKKKTRPFILRRCKNEVLQDLPPKTEHLIWVDMSPETRTLYDSYKEQFKAKMLKKIQLDGIKTHRMQVLEFLLRLRQLCCHPLLISENYPSLKLERLLSDLEELILSNKKVLLYSQFSQMLRLIEKDCQKRGWSYVYLDGETKDRQAPIDAFQNDSSISLFLLTLKVGGVGLNLTAADEVILYDPWWNEAVENQAIDRAHRLGREKQVNARRYLTTQTIEEKMYELKNKKTLLASHFLEEEKNIERFTYEDLVELFS